MEPYVSAALTFLFTVLPVICILLGAMAFESRKSYRVWLVVACGAGWVVFNTLLVGVWTYIGSTTPGSSQWLWLPIVAAVALNIGALWGAWPSSD